MNLHSFNKISVLLFWASTLAVSATAQITFTFSPTVNPNQARLDISGSIRGHWEENRQTSSSAFLLPQFEYGSVEWSELFYWRDSSKSMFVDPNPRANSGSGKIVGSGTFLSDSFSPSIVPMGVWQRVQNVPIVPPVRSIKVRLDASKIGLCCA